jgi:hypothetical protein
MLLRVVVVTATVRATTAVAAAAVRVLRPSVVGLMITVVVVFFNVCVFKRQFIS